MMHRCNRAEEILSESARRWPERWAVTAQDGRVSYVQLDAAANDICDALTAAGVAQGSIIGISLEHGRYFLATLFGILRAQCVAIPIAPNLSASERARLIVEAGVNAIVGEAHDSSPSDLIVIDDPYQMGASLVLEICHPRTTHLALFRDAAIIRYTSGTTGLSKGVVLSNQAVIERARISQQLLGVQERDAIMAVLPLSYHFIASAVAFISAGANILDCASLSSAGMLELGATHNASILYASPAQYELLCRAQNAKALPNLRRAISTSALISPGIAEAFKARFKRSVTRVYGIIEVGLPLWNEGEVAEPFALGICKAPYECMLVDESGESVDATEIGELAIRGPGLFSGYLVGDGAGDRRESNQWVYTGDLVSRDSSGVITYRGRKKSVINSGGSKIFPEEVEAVLLRAPEIQTVRVSSEPHDILGSVVIAEIVLAPQAEESIEAWSSLCRDELSEYKIPVEFRIVESLPSTGSGKVIRHTASDESRVG